MIEVIFGAVRAVAKNWHEEAGRRRKITQTDPVADTLEHCASEIEDQIQDLEAKESWLSVEDYAELVDKTPQTVRAWIRAGRLQATPTKDGLRIRRGVQPLKRTA